MRITGKEKELLKRIMRNFKSIMYSSLYIIAKISYSYHVTTINACMCVYV